MSATYEYQQWIHQCCEIIRQAEIDKIRRKRILLALISNEIYLQLRKKKYAKKRFWVHPIFKLRSEHGFFEAVFPTLSSYSDKFENYFRMSATEFEELLCLVSPFITKENVIRNAISATARLAMTLR